MEPFILEPSKLKFANLQDIIQGFCTKFEEVYQKGYHRLAFLSNTPFEQIWRDDLLRTRSKESIVLKAVRATSGTQGVECETEILYSMRWSYSSSYCAPAVLSSVPSIPATHENMARWLVDNLWQNFFTQESRRDPRMCFKKCCTLFPRLFENANAFLQTPATITASSVLQNKTSGYGKIISLLQLLLPSSSTLWLL